MNKRVAPLAPSDPVQLIPGRRSVTNTRNLLLVSFFTLTLTAFIFLFAILHFDLTNREIFSQVDNSVAVQTRNSELNRMLVSLELDIRELINVILHESYRLTREKGKLQDRFEQIAVKAAEGENSPPQQELLEQLSRYRASFEKLLWDYGAINSALYEVYFYINSFGEQFKSMEEVAGQLMVEMAARGKNTDAVQQAYMLIIYAHEQMLQVHILVNSSLADNKSQVLGVQVGREATADGQQTALDKITAATHTLQTLRAADDSIAIFADNILATLPLFRENIVDLAGTITTLAADYTVFKLERDACLHQLEEVNAFDRERMMTLSRTVNSYGRNGRIVGWFIALAVLIVSVTGLLLTRKISRQLALTAEEALRAQQRGEKLNTQLHSEVEERQLIADDLRLVRDELEQRVKDRTAQLSDSNRSLALEIEERKNVEYALASEKERLTVTLRSIGDGVITTGVNGTVVLLNKVAEELTGWSQGEAYGRPLREVFNIVHKKTGEPCSDPVDFLLRTGSIVNLADDTVLVSRNGSRLDIADSGAPIRDRDSIIIGAVLVFRDITLKRKLDEDALKTEKLNSVGVLAGGIAHDFNNILAAILGNISLARLQLKQDKNGQGRTDKLLEDAEKASLRARSLTQQLLTFAKGGEPVRKMESISDIIRDSTDFILSGGKVRCQYGLADNLWPVNIDAGQISQVIQNLIINAMHAMPDGGVIEITGDNFVNDQRQVVSLPAENYVRLVIKDQGAGIPEEFLNRIFDPYFTTKDEGSGLGLTLTHSIVSKHLGHIEVQSGEWGTAFTIYMPALPEYQFPREPVGARLDERPTRARVLIMDDEAMVRDIAREMLLHMGFEVETAIDGEQTLAIYQARLGTAAAVDLVIMDLTIPGGMGGKEAIRRLQAMDPGVRAIVSSGYSNDPVMADYQKYGFAGVVNKPFQLSEFLQTINEVLGPGHGKSGDGTGSPAGWLVSEGAE